MSPLRIRWSEHEASKPYARPFGVTFVDSDGSDRGSVAVSGHDLLYLHQFQAAVLTLGGELFDDPGLREAADPQLAWLDILAAALPALAQIRLVPRSSFHHDSGRAFTFSVLSDGAAVAGVDGASVLEYQEFQAVVAHQSGRLYRVPDIESVSEPQARRRAWLAVLRDLLARPEADEAMTEVWPWR